ncbi:SDR family NAD(P)-dependent oxidoreductase [Desulfatitalea tepidiphila]|uniref:SDR family NAD(P)-dependent oxidoreductase n=1 Tax=Desulfatitalea tepidiphila TaxID=1185843 RepID=UPI0006B4D6D1|nr:SDR family NAD(P)-dependent oxidoreductase [Desulfatitalea tepidiphila]
MRFNGKSIVITGGAGGLGRAFALGFAQEGGNILIADINEERLAQNASEINAVGGGRCETAICDVTQPQEVEATISRSIACFGSIDILINNAGGSLGVPKVPIDQVDEQDWDRVVNLNLKGTFLCTRAAAGHMKKAGRGKIVNLSSITARVGGQLTPVHYVSAKGAIIAFTRHVAQELGPHGINVNAVAPGIVLSGERLEKMWYERKTEQERSDYLKQVPLRRLGSPEEIAQAVLYLSSPAADLITGVTLDINGGLFSA